MAFSSGVFRAQTKSKFRLGFGVVLAFPVLAILVLALQFVGALAFAR